MTEIAVLDAVKAPSTLYWGPRRPIFIIMRLESSFFVKMWPSNEFEFETPALYDIIFAVLGALTNLVRNLTEILAH